MTKEASRYRNLVIEITSNNSSRISLPKTLRTLAVATFSSETCGEIMDPLWWRCNDSAAGNWKHGLKALQALAWSRRPSRTSTTCCRWCITRTSR